MATERPEEEFDKNLWGEALEGVDISGLGQGRGQEYPTASPKEISAAYEHDPLREALMRLGNEISRAAQAQAEGGKRRERRYHEVGWELAIETPQGIVGLWSCWLGNQFYLGYPKPVLPPRRPETDELIMRVLDVERAQPVRQVNAVAVNSWNEEDPYFKDPDKPLERNEAGQIVAYKDAGLRLWTRFYGPLDATGGRVWVDSSNFHSNSFHFRYLEDDRLERIYYGHDQSNGVFTFQFSEHNQYAPDGPTADPRAIQKYRDRFIQLATEVAFVMGGPRAINVSYGLDDQGITLVPEDLYREGYYDIEWLKGDLGERKGWGNEIVRGRKGDSIVVLESGNSLVPWSTLLHTSATRLTSPAMLAGFIREDILWF